MIKSWLILVLLLLLGSAWAQLPHPPEEQPGPMEEWREEKQEEAIEFLSKYIEAERLEKLKVKHPMAYRRLLRHALKEKRGLEHLKEVDPERFEVRSGCLKLELRTNMLAEDYRTTEANPKKEELKKELRTVLEQLFDLKEKEREFELKRLEKEIVKLKDIGTERKKNKKEIIERHLDELLLEKEYLRW